MPSIRRNVFANIGGNAAVALLSFIFIPVYVRVLGIEAYGLIGFFLSIQVVFSLLDLGLGAAITRELARVSGDPSEKLTARQIIRTAEIVYWLVGVLIGVLTVFLVPPLALKWISLDNLSPEQAKQGLALMGIAFAARWPFTLYAGALVGLDRQPLLNVLRVCAEATRSAGAAAVLLLVSPTLSAFLSWQIGTSLLSSVAAAWITWKTLPASASSATFDLLQLRRIHRYMIGVSGISVTAVVLTQADKIILSRLVSLEDFGYYMLAWAVANSLNGLSAPVFAAYFPSLSRAVAVRDEGALRNLYHRGSQVVSGMLIPVAVTLSFFSQEALALWTHDAVLAEKTHIALTVLTFGTIFHGLMQIPYALMLAHGWTSLPFYANLVAIIALVPLVSVLAQVWGAIGAATAWVALNVGHVVLTQQVLHRRLLPAEKSLWLIDDSFKPLIICCVIAGAARLLFNNMTMTQFSIAGSATLAICFVACVWSLPHLRSGFLSFARRFVS